MAFYKQTEVSEMIGKSRPWVNTYIKRGKLILSGEFIDDSIDMNKKFIEKWKKKFEESKKEQPPTIKKEKAPEIGVPEFPKQKAPNIQEPEKIEITESSSDSLDVAKKKAEIKFKLSQIEKNELQSQKLRGESIPTNLVAGLISTLGRGFQNAYKFGAEALLIEMAHSLKMSATAEAKFKGKLIELINKAHADAISEAKQTIETIVSEVANVEANKND